MLLFLYRSSPNEGGARRRKLNRQKKKGSAFQGFGQGRKERLLAIVFLLFWFFFSPRLLLVPLWTRAASITNRPFPSTAFAYCSPSPPGRTELFTPTAGALSLYLFIYLLFLVEKWLTRQKEFHSQPSPTSIFSFFSLFFLLRGTGLTLVSRVAFQNPVKPNLTQ